MPLLRDVKEGGPELPCEGFIHNIEISLNFKKTLVTVFSEENFVAIFHTSRLCLILEKLYLQFMDNYKILEALLALFTLFANSFRLQDI